MKVHLPKDLESALRAMVASGRYPTESEAVAAAVRLLQDRELLREARLREIRESIREGDASAETGGWLEGGEVFAWVSAEGRKRLSAERRRRKRA
jgi:antitoxin ParD1/3/4